MIKKLNILMVAPEPIFEPRGTPFSVVGRLKALSDMGARVDLLTYSMGENIRLPGLCIHRIPRLPGISKIKIGPSFQKIPLDFFLMLSTVTHLSRGGYDLMHTHEEAGLWGTFLSRWFGVPHVYDMHSSLPQQLKNFEFTQSRLIRSLFVSLEAWILKYASAVITICPDLEQHVADQLPGRGSVLIENVVDYASVFGETDRTTEIKSELNLSGKQVALYTGTLESYQGLSLLIESAVRVREKQENVIFLVVGGHPDQVAHYQNQARQAGLADAMIFTGQVRPEAVNSYIRCADILVTPRVQGTNTPLKIYAYLRSGVPIVATRILTHTQVLDDGVAELTAPDAQGFSAGILKVLKDKAHRNRLIENAVKLAEARYSYAVYQEKLKRVISLAMERGV